jgi:hypothetical protein
MSKFEEGFNIFLFGADTTGLSDPSKPRPVVDLGWEERVRLNLMTISTKKIGCAVLTALRYYGIPLWITKPSPGGCGAGVWADTLYLGSQWNGNKRILEVHGGRNLEYDPARHDVHSSCMTGKAFRQNIYIPGHQTLFHELVHAVRRNSGKANAKDLTKGGLAFYDDTEEFYAVLLQGIYASETGMPVRESHTQSFEIDPALNGSFDFFKSSTETYGLIKTFCQEHPVLSKGIAGIRTRFNPIRAFYSNPAKAKSLSNAPLAHQRGKGEPALKIAWERIRNDFKRVDPTAP